MSGSRSSSGPARDAKVSAVTSSSDLPELDTRSSSSWANSADVEIQRDLVASRVFDGKALTIGRFEVEKLVGAGASAAVYAARDPLLDRRVAVKVLARVHEGRLDAAIERLIREARALAHLSHRNVVAIYEVGQWNDRPFIAMELIEGTTLGQWLAAKRRSMAEIVAVFREAGRGLAAAHTRGHVHRDFKPANVLVAYDGRVVVSDFGLVDDAAQDGEAAEVVGAPAALSSVDARDGATRCRGPVGTPAYAAPEQQIGAAAHPSADVYSFALALVEALLGYHPAPESTTAWKSALRGRVPSRLHRELCAAMALHPQQRAQSLGPLLEALSPRSRLSWPRVASTAATALVVMIMAAVLSWSPRERASARVSEVPPPHVLPLDAEKITSEVRALLATPSENRDTSWSVRARTVLTLPIPTKVPCEWRAPPRVILIIGTHAVALDQEGRVMSCTIPTGAIATIAEDAICLRRYDRDMLGVAFRDRTIAVYQTTPAGWRRVPLAGSPTIDRDTSHPLCPFIMISDAGVLSIIHASPRGSIVAAGSGRKLIHKIDSGSSLWLQEGDAAPERVVPSIDSFRVDAKLHYGVLNTRGHVQVFDFATRNVVADAPTTVEPHYVDITRDGSVAVALLRTDQLLWWRRGMRQWENEPTKRSYYSVALSPRGERALLGGVAGTLDVRELASGRRYPLLLSHVRHAQFLDDDQVVAIDKSDAVWWWSLARLRSSELADHAGESWIWGFATCDGRSVVTATNRKDRPILISSPSGAPQRTLLKPPDAQIYDIACEGDRILSGTRDGHLLVWESRTGRMLADHDVGIRAWLWTLATAQLPDGARVDLVGTGQIFGPRPSRIGGRVIALREGAMTPVFTAQFGLNTGIGEITVSSDGRRAAAVASSGELALIDVARATTISTQRAHLGEARRVRFMDGDRRIMTAGDDGYLRVWRADNLALDREIYVGRGKIFDLDLRGARALVSTSDGHVGEWDLVAGRLTHAYSAYTAWVATARFDTSGGWAVSGDYNGRACVHRAHQDGCHLALIGHKQTQPVRHVAFLDDRQIITASEDGTVRQWNPPLDASNAELVCELQSYVFDRVPGAATPNCGPGLAVRLRRGPRR